MHPVVLGAGLTLLTEQARLTLLSVKRFDCGALAVVYS